MRIGIAGLGIIGTRMAANWRKAGHEVLGWNRTRARAEGLGLPLYGTPAELAAPSDVVVIVVADPPAVHSVIAGAQGIASIALRGKMVLNASTVDAATNRKAAAAVEAAGGRFLETPFTGSKTGAESATLVFFVGGDEGVFRRAEPLLLQVGRKAFHFGPVGAAADTKLAMNLILANYMQAMAEGFLYARKAGVDMQTFVEAFRLNAGWCPLAELKVPKIIGRDFSPHFSLKHMDKDLRLALERAEETGAELPHTLHLKELFNEAMERGWGDEDFAVLCRALE
jgi:3-hydroxyisobutyrate dehydrogenase-like beta-hydroxyacid dehydrogenase